MPLSNETRRRIAAVIEGNDVVLFMKGNRAAPECGFSAKVVGILDELLPAYETVDVLADSEIRGGIKEFSSWPTIPQLYVKGELLGGCDIISELYANGELYAKLGLDVPERKVPSIVISDAAAARIGELAQRAPGKELRLSVDRAYQASLSLAAPHGGEIEAQANGIKVLMDVATAQRADGLSIDVVESATGVAFKIDNPNAPSDVKQISAGELKKLMDDGVEFELLDVRTPEERAIAAIDGACLLDEEAAARLATLSRDTMLVFHCHHGGRSQEAAEHFRSRGFTNVYSVAGGIDAWSLEVDPGVPRY